MTLDVTAFSATDIGSNLTYARISNTDVIYYISTGTNIRKIVDGIGAVTAVAKPTLVGTAVTGSTAPLHNKITVRSNGQICIIQSTVNGSSEYANEVAIIEANGTITFQGTLGTASDIRTIHTQAPPPWFSSSTGRWHFLFHTAIRSMGTDESYMQSIYWDPSTGLSTPVNRYTLGSGTAGVDFIATAHQNPMPDGLRIRYRHRRPSNLTYKEVLYTTATGPSAEIGNSQFGSTPHGAMTVPITYQSPTWKAGFYAIEIINNSVTNFNDVVRIESAALSNSDPINNLGESGEYVGKTIKATGLRADDLETTLHIYVIYELDSTGEYYLKFMTMDIDMRYDALAGLPGTRTFTELSDVQLTDNSVVGTPVVAMDGYIFSQPLVTIGTQLTVFTQNTSNSYSWFLWNPQTTIILDSELTAVLSSTGGRQLDALVDVLYLSNLTAILASVGGNTLSGNINIRTIHRVLALLEINNAVSGVLIAPQNEKYTLNISGVELPIAWFTIRKTIAIQDNAFVNVEAMVTIPLMNTAILDGIIGGSANLYKQVTNGNFSTLLGGIFTEYTIQDNNLNLLLTAIIPKASGTILVSDMYYIRNSSGQTTIRTPAFTSIGAGQTVDTGTLALESTKTVLHVSESNSFLEIT